VILVALAPPVHALSVSVWHDPVVPPTVDVSVYFYLSSSEYYGGVKSVEVTARFDESIVYLETIDPGWWFRFWEPGFRFFHSTTPGTDTIHFLGVLLGHTQVVGGIIAECHFEALAEGVSGIHFQDVSVRDTHGVDLGAGHSILDQIIIDFAIANESLSFGEVKKLYR